MYHQTFVDKENGSLFEKGQLYESCHFVRCDFQNSNISNIQFEDCIFEDCDMSNSIVTDTSFQSCQMSRCKVIGLRWDSCNQFLFRVSFLECKLDNSVFHGLKLESSQFESCSMRFVDFERCQLKRVVLEECDLEGAIFKNTNLSNTNLLTSFNFSIDPSANNVTKLLLHNSQLPYLLKKFDLNVIA